MNESNSQSGSKPESQQPKGVSDSQPKNNPRHPQDNYVFIKWSDRYHHYGQRAFFHDYKSPSIYHVTIKKMAHVPRLSEIKLKNPEDIASAYYKASQMGVAVGKAYRLWIKQYQFLRSYAFVIMPDHIHFVVRVQERIPRAFGSYVGAFVTKVRQLAGEMEFNFPKDIKIFKPYVDTILYGQNQLDTMVRYVKRNPIRYMIKKTHSDFFYARPQIWIDNVNYTAIGNLNLLFARDIVPVIWHRRYSAAEWAAIKSDYLAAISEGAVMISAFINPNEKDILRAAIESEKGAVILLDFNGFAERYAPGGRLERPCAEGRFLHLSSYAFDISKKKPSRSECLSLNGIAERIAAGMAEIII